MVAPNPTANVQQAQPAMLVVWDYVNAVFVPVQGGAPGDLANTDRSSLPITIIARPETPLPMKAPDLADLLRVAVIELRTISTLLCTGLTIPDDPQIYRDDPSLDPNIS